MLSLKSRLARYDAGAWLDVATGRGEFLKFALDSFNSWKSAAGIDNDPEPLSRAKEQLVNTPVVLVLASALQMPFTDENFDTVTMSNALHHIEDLKGLFSETVRVCRPDGLVIINEMVNENKSASEDTYLLYHRLISDIDHQFGRYHRETYTIKEMLSLVSTDNFQLTDYFMHESSNGNIMNPEEIEAVSERLRRKVAQLKGSDYYYFFENKAREAINIFTKNGISRPRHATFFIRVVK